MKPRKEVQGDDHLNTVFFTVIHAHTNMSCNQTDMLDEELATMFIKNALCIQL